MKRHLLWLLFNFCLLAVAAGGVLWDMDRMLNTPLKIQHDQKMHLPTGSRLRDAVTQLKGSEAWLNARQPIYLEVWARARDEASRIKAGEYALSPDLTPLGLLDKLVDGEIVLHELRLIEGWTFGEALNVIRSHPEIVHTPESRSAQSVMAALGRPDLHPEGRFFPDTYRFSKGTTDMALLRQSFKAMERVLAESWSGRAGDLPYEGPEEALIMASIVEKETGLASEREQIAGVFVRRLKIGMRLQTDPTIIYGMGESFDGNIRKKDLLTDGPYNTYTRGGLTPTPICLPGRASIEAALHPAEGDALFFVSKGDGSHQFSATLAAHEAAVREYQLNRRRRVSQEK